MLIKEMIDENKPREMLLKYGVENLSDVDLLSIILRCGTKNQSVREVSNNVLKYSKSIKGLKNVTFEELCRIKGVGLVKAQIILSCIELGKRINNLKIENKMILNNSKIVHDAFKGMFDNKQEKLLAIFLDTKKRLISYKVVFIGTVDSAPSNPREIFNNAIKEMASSIVIIHNHPSGNVLPSIEDINITNRLIETGKIIGIPVIDHLITNGKDYYSFYEKYYKK